MLQKIPPPSDSRTTPTNMTKRFRFLPEFDDEIAPRPRPTIARRMMNQFAQPISGMNAIAARISATPPIRRENKLSMAGLRARWVKVENGQFILFLNPSVPRKARSYPEFGTMKYSFGALMALTLAL